MFFAPFVKTNRMYSYELGHGPVSYSAEILCNSSISTNCSFKIHALNNIYLMWVKYGENIYVLQKGVYECIHRFTKTTPETHFNPVSLIILNMKKTVKHGVTLSRVNWTKTIRKCDALLRFISIYILFKLYLKDLGLVVFMENKMI